MKSKINIQEAIRNTRAQIRQASGNFYEWAMSDDDDWRGDPSWLIESCFLQLLTLTEILDLSELRRMIYEEYSKTKESQRGFAEVGSDPDGDSYSPALVRITRFIEALENLFPKEDGTSVTRDLLEIVRNVHYVITDTTIYPNTPANERDVHLRIEAILKCVFPDLKRHPSITKQIKNFEPDTGIPSISTLIEYKFLSRQKDVGPMADQLLADTRGYTSRDWSRFLYVIYETNRFRTEKDWNQLVRESGVAKNTTVVVLSGEPLKEGQPQRSNDQPQIGEQPRDGQNPSKKITL